MNILFRLFIFLGSLVVIALFGALIAPYFINWDEFTSEFEAQASKVIGQEVKVGGKTNLRILPLPFLSFEDLQVGKNADGSPLMTVEQFSFNAELLPFLSGEVRIVEMSMRRPIVNLHVDENGTVAWTNPKDFVVNPEQVNIEKLNIEEGAISVTGLVGEHSLQLDNIKGDLSARSILGPWRLDASANVEGVESEIKISTGTFQEDGSLRLKMDLNRKDQPYNLLLDGPVKLQNDALSWDGEFRVSPFSKTQLEAMLPRFEPLPVLASGNFQATPQQITIREYRLDVGSRDDPYTITGQGTVDVRDNIYFKVQADGRQIDIDQLQQSTQSGDKKSLENRLTALLEILKRVPVPTAKGEIDVILPAIVAGDTFIRDVNTLISPTGQGWILRRLKATLPGNTAFEANGRLGLQNGFGFSGKLLIASRQPSGFADWVSGNVDETFRRLKSVGLSADITMSKRQTTLENVELRLDDALLRGKLQRLSSQDDRPAILAELKGNRVNVDDLSAIYSLTETSDQKNAAHDLNIKVKADVFEAMIASKPFVANALDAHVQINEGTVSIERLNAENILGAKLATSGRIENVLVKPDGNMKLELSADNASQLLGFANQFLGENDFIKTLQSRSDLTKGTKLNIELDTTKNSGTASGAKGRLLVNGLVGGTTIAIQTSFDGSLDDLTSLPLTIDGKLQNEQPSVLLQQLGLQTLPVDLIGEIPGGLKLDLGFTGIAREGFDSTISLSGKDVTLATTGKVQTTNWNDYDAQLAVTLGAKDLAAFIQLVDIQLPIDVADKTLPASASFDLNKLKSDFEFNNLKGQISGNGFSGKLKLEQEQVLRPRLSGQIALSKASLPVIAEAVFGRTTTLGNSLGVGTDISLDENSIFGQALFTGLDSNISVNANSLNLSEVLTGEKAKFQIAMIDGAIDINAISFGLFGGQFEGGLNLKNTAGNVLVNLNYSLLGMDAQLFNENLGLNDFLSGKLVLNGSAEASGKSFASLISNLSGNGFIALNNGDVRGINLDALDGILEAASVDNYDVTADKVAELFSKTALNSGFKIGQFDTPFSINRGKLRARNVRFEKGNTSLTSDVEFDLLNRILEANTVVAFEPGKRERIAGADPQTTIIWQGPLNALERSINVDRLEGYLSLRAFEISQRRLEALEAQVIEKQRLRGEIAYAFAKEKYDERQRIEAIRLEEERKLREAEEARLAEEERKRLAAEEARRLEEERKQREAEEQRRLEAERKLREAEEARRLEEARKLREAEEAERIRKAQEAAERERQRKIAEAKKREEEARLARLKAEAEEIENLRRLQEQNQTVDEGIIFQSIEEFLNAN